MNNTLAVLAVLAALVPPSRAATLIGVAWPNGVYRIDASTGAGTSIGSPAVNGLNSLARNLSGALYSVDSSGNLLVINPSNGSATVATALNFGGDLVSVPALAFAPDGTLYAVNNGEVDDLYTVNVATGVGTRVGPTGRNTLQGLACSPAGTLYGWDIQIGLVTLNKTTGAATDVNPSQGASADLQCLAFAPDGSLYGAQNGLFTLDPATGIPTQVGSGGFYDLRGIEFETGPAFRLSITSTSGSAVRICWPSKFGESYQLESRDGLSPTNTWQDAGPVIPGTGAEQCVTNLTSGNAKFFRLKLAP